MFDFLKTVQLPPFQQQAFTRLQEDVFSKYLMRPNGDSLITRGYMYMTHHGKVSLNSLR